MLKAYYQKTLTEAGCDEAGRGCYAGPVFAAAVILPKTFRHRHLNDSKQLTADQRDSIRHDIERKAVCFAVAMVDQEEIDRINILRASFKAMHLAVSALRQQPEYLLIDGNRFDAYSGIPHTCVVRGDGIYASIAAASVLAKTHRDEYMIRLHDQYPHYGWNSNKGYGTPEHRDAIEKHGICDHHRKSFNILPAQMEMAFV